MNICEKELSHITVYGSDDCGADTPVPEPAAMVLLGSGIVGLGYFRKKIRA